MKSIRFVRLVLLLPLTLWVTSEARAGQLVPVLPAADITCLGTQKPPVLFSGDVIAPQTLYLGEFPPPNWNPEWGRLSRGGVHYVSASMVQARLVTDRCSQVNSVRFGTRNLTTSPTDGYWYSTTSEPVAGQPGRMAHAVTVHFPKGHDGSSDEVNINAGRPIVTRPSDVLTYSFPLVRVNRVEAEDVVAPVGISEAELFNVFSRILYWQFNGPVNSAQIQVDGGTVRIYGYDPDSTYVRVDPQGVSFGFRFKIDKPCQPRAQVQGRFKLNAGFDGISVAWIVSPYANLQATSGVCNLLQLIPLVGLVLDHVIEGAEGDVASSVQGRLEEAVRGMFASVTNIGLLLAGSTMRTGELLIHLNLEAPSVRIQVPYDAFDMVRSGMIVPANEPIAIVASDLSPPDYTGGGQPATLRSGPNGLPLTGTTDWPNALTLYRVGTLPWTGAPVARLLARRYEPQRTVTFQYRPGCAVAASSMPSSIRFGVNDTASDAQRLRPNWSHGYWVRVFFGVIVDVPPCDSYSSDGVPPPTPDW